MTPCLSTQIVIGTAESGNVAWTKVGALVGVVDVVLNLEKQTMVTCNKDSVGRFFHETLGELAAKVACQKFNMVWWEVVGWRAKGSGADLLIERLGGECTAGTNDKENHREVGKVSVRVSVVKREARFVATHVDERIE